MANSGMFYKKVQATPINEAEWWEERCVVRQGGYDLDQSNLPTGLQWLPKGTVFKFKQDGSGQAIALKSCKVINDAKSGASTLEIAPNHLLKVGDTLGDGITINAISKGAYKDTLTVSTLNANIKSGTVLSDLKSTDVVLGFSYDTLDVRERDNCFSVTPTLRVEEVYEETLPYFINDEIKDAINKYGYARFRII